MLHMYFTGDTNKSITNLKGKTSNGSVMYGAQSPCFAFKEILKDIVRPILLEQKQGFTLSSIIASSKNSADPINNFEFGQLV